MTLTYLRPPLFALCLGTALCGGGAAQAAATGWSGDAKAAVRLITSTDGVAGATLNAGLQFRFAEGWHGYWRTPGDAGIAPQIDWSRSDNVAGADVTWPAPHRLVIEGLQNSIYEDQIVLPIKFGLKNSAATTRIEVRVSYAACSDICVPYQADLTLPLSSGTQKRSAEAPLVEHAKGLVPGSPQSAQINVVRAIVGGEQTERKLTVELQSDKPFAGPDLFVEGAGNGIPAAPEVNFRDGRRFARLTVALPASASANRPLTLTLVDSDRAAEFSTATGAGIVPSSSGTFAALLSALFGGLILNLMPCVLPVLSIKLFAFTRHASEGLAAIRLGALATAAGITFSFLVIALSLIVLKWSGATLGWGIQFQQPWFLAGMATVTVLFAASFFELLPIAMPSSRIPAVLGRTRHVLLEAFLVGAFATLLATPCSAPFVGTAVGFALTRGPSDIVIIFLCLGIGMSLPYLMAAAAPGSVRLLPRPGRWMILLRQVLGLLLLGTAVWLLFVLWSTAGAFVATLTSILLASLIGFRALLCHIEGTIVSRWSKTVTTVLVLAPLVVAISAASPAAVISAEPQWQRFDPVALQRLVDEGKTVLVDVAATWCLTCKVNDLTVFENNEIRSHLARPDVVRMRADWTRPDPAVATYLHHFARFGIPLDVVYGPRQPEGKALPELLTPAILIRALGEAAAATDVEEDLSLTGEAQSQRQ